MSTFAEMIREQQIVQGRVEQDFTIEDFRMNLVRMLEDEFCNKPINTQTGLKIANKISQAVEYCRSIGKEIVLENFRNNKAEFLYKNGFRETRFEIDFDGLELMSTENAYMNPFLDECGMAIHEEEVQDDPIIGRLQELGVA